MEEFVPNSLEREFHVYAVPQDHSDQQECYPKLLCHARQTMPYSAWISVMRVALSDKAGRSQ